MSGHTISYKLILEPGKKPYDGPIELDIESRHLPRKDEVILVKRDGRHMERWLVDSVVYVVDNPKETAKTGLAVAVVSANMISQ